MSKPKQSNKPVRKKPKACKISNPTPKDIPHSWKHPKYRPEMCDEIQEYYREGMSDVQVSAKLGICKDTFYEWIKVIPEFSEATKAGKTLSECWWESIGQAAVRGEIKGDSKIWYANMKNRFKWRDNPAEPKEEGGELLKSLAEMVALHKSKEREY